MSSLWKKIPLDYGLGCQPTECNNQKAAAGIFYSGSTGLSDAVSGIGFGSRDKEIFPPGTGNAGV